MNKNKNNFDIFEFLWLNRKPIIFITLLGAICSIIYSFIIEVKYKSQVIAYPAITNNVSFAAERGENENLSSFGDDNQVEQMLQILKSNKLSTKITQKFNLLKHYKIDPSSSIKDNLLTLKYQENINFDRTMLGSVVISVYDIEPQLAADIANYIPIIYDSIKNDMIINRANTALLIAEKTIKKVEDERNIVINILDSLSNKGVVDKDSKANLSLAMSNANNSEVRQDLKDKMDSTDKYGNLYDNYIEHIEHLNVRLGNISSVHDQIKADANFDLSHLFIVEHAYKADKKAKPVRWLIVVTSTISAFVFSIFIIIFLAKFKEILSNNKK